MKKLLMIIGCLLVFSACKQQGKQMVNNLHVGNSMNFISDSTFLLSEVEVDIKSSNIKLEDFKEYKSFYLDINFDDEKELITTHPLAGQRFLTVYIPHKLSSNGDWEIDTAYNRISENYIYPMFDEWTELDFTNKLLIISLWAGYNGNQKDFYKTTNGNLQLYKKEFYYCFWDSLGKRIIYNGNDSIVTYHNNGEKHFVKRWWQE